MPNRFVISDTHFNHANILKFSDEHGATAREFDSVEHMNETMIDRWNSVVKPEDTIYHLGDVFLQDMKNAPNVLRRLNGKKKLTLGNHDQKSKLPILIEFFDDIDLWYCFPKEGITLSHMPLHPTVLAEDRVGKLSVHGHIHKNPSPPGPYKCVCVEQINYTPLAFEELK